jgi:hypothetical protein
VASILCWITGTALVIVGIITNRNGIPGLGIIFVAAGSVMNVRSFFAQHGECLRNAFEMGRDYERAQQQGTLRSLQ